MPPHRSETIESGLPVRSIFISDLHLGSQFCRCEEVLEFLRGHTPDYLFLVGDFIDAWALQRQWHWPEIYTLLLQRVVELSQQGTQVRYTPGNHDDYLRQNFGSRQALVIHDQFIHTCIDGTRMMVIHGDQFDDVETQAQWLSRVGSKIYDGMLFGDRVIGQTLRTIGLAPRPFSHRVKRLTKKVIQRISGFERRLVVHATENDCHGIICGHLHRPQDRMLGSIRYINLGDWIENASALIEHADGRLELLHWGRGPAADRQQPTAAAELFAAAEIATAGKLRAETAQLTADLLADLPFAHPLERRSHTPD